MYGTMGDALAHLMHLAWDSRALFWHTAIIRLFSTSRLSGWKRSPVQFETGHLAKLLDGVHLGLWHHNWSSLNAAENRRRQRQRQTERKIQRQNKKRQRLIQMKSLIVQLYLLSWLATLLKKVQRKSKSETNLSPVLLYFCNGKQDRTESSLGHKAICGEHACCAINNKSLW